MEFKSFPTPLDKLEIKRVCHFLSMGTMDDKKSTEILDLNKNFFKDFLRIIFI